MANSTNGMFNLSIYIFVCGLLYFFRSAHTSPGLEVTGEYRSENTPRCNSIIPEICEFAINKRQTRRTFEAIAS
ncbi:hypothetical protein AALO_G00197810 [Alosa alosa]|uniref:Secreted protein n=1 Tax=Alosa alosa TaxID=278164 RepID=A0AAV6G4M3_9TELE|nr:hypothetical protein AALO_G00197810 [Alosa alosa]